MSQRKKKPAKLPGDEFYESIGEHLKSLRENAGITRANLATEIQVSIDTVYAWEIGRSTPSVKLYPKIAKALGLSYATEVLPDYAVA